MTSVLYVGAGTPWLGGAGYLLRQDLFLRALAEVADLNLAMFDIDSKSSPPFQCQITPLAMPRRKSASKMKLFMDDLISSEPRMIRGYDLREPRRAVAALEPQKFDFVFAYRIDFGHFAGVLHHPRLILDIDDPEHMRWQRRLAVALGSRGDWRTRRDIEKLKRFEYAAAAGAKISIVCQEGDKHDFPTVPIVVPNCVEIIENPPRRPRDPRLLFVGDCSGGNNSPNGDAVLFFLREIWPSVRLAVPDAKFQIVGRVNDAIQKLAGGRGEVIISGFVNDLSSVYAQANVAIAPIRFGTGTRVKILEAFAHACPVVATGMGVEGIDAVDGRDFALGNAAGSFAARCIELIRDPPMAEKLGQAGYNLAAQRFDRRKQHQRIVQLLRELFAGIR